MDNINQKSPKAEKMASGRRGNSSRDSNMQSEHDMETPRPSPLRSAALRPENTEVKVAGIDYGGARQKIQPSSESIIVDNKGNPLPLDKAVVEEINAGHKEEEPINHQNQELEPNVRVGLKKATKLAAIPTWTVFNSMGGGRKSASTALDFGGAGGKKASDDDLPKEFEYREEDFMPLSAQSNTSQHGSSLSRNKSAPSGTKAPSPSKAGTQKPSESAPYYGLESTFFKQSNTHHTHKSNAVDSPELNLGTLFPEESSSKTAKKSNFHHAIQPHIHHHPHYNTDSPEESAPKKSYKLAFNNSPSAFKAPAHIANEPKSKHTLTQMAHKADSRRHEEPHTPEMSFGQLFQENEEPSTRHYQPSTQALPKSLRAHAFVTPSGHDTKISSDQQQLHAKTKAPIEHLDDVDDGSAPMLHSLSQQFFAKSPSHHSTSAPIHQSAMPPVHHAPPAHHSAPEHHFPTENITPLYRADAPVHHTAPVHHAPTQVSASGVADPMQLAHAAPIYHAPSITGQPLPSAHHDGPSHRAPTQIETIHVPHHTPAHASHVPTERHTHIETIHAAYHPEAPKTKTWHGAEVPAKDVEKAATASHPSNALPHPVATSDFIPAPAHEILNQYPALALGKSHDEPIKSKNDDSAPVKSQKDGAGLNAASFPSVVRHDAPVHVASARAHAYHTESNHKAAAAYKGPIHAAVPYRAPPPELHPKAAHIHAQHTPTQEHRPSKRERKAAKKQEVSRSLGVLGSISEALVGRRKNSVSTPVMHLNEIFGEAEGPIAHNAPPHAHGPAHGAGVVAPAAAVAAGLDGIRNLLGAIHMPAMISRHPSDNVHRDEPKMASESAHDTHVVGHSQHKHTPSKAVALKTPKVNLSLFPEEDASYPRGEASKHENPAHPKNIVDITEILYQLPTCVAGHSQHKHTPSKAVALKTPKVNLSLFPEEDASYPRGEASKHENPAHPKSIVDITEILYQLPTHAPAHAPVHSRVPAAVIQAPAVHARALPGHMHLDLHTHPVPHQPAMSAQSSHSSYVVDSIHPQHKLSKAVALKKPKTKLNVFPEEEADYPRGDQGHLENKPSHPLHKPIAVQEVQLATATSRKSRRQRKNSKAAALKRPTVPVDAYPEEEAEYPRGDRHYDNVPSQPMHRPIEVQEVHLDAAHLHSHHDLHPTMSESAAAAVSSGLEGFKAMIGGIHMPAMSNPAAKATVASLGAAAAVQEATSHKEHKDRQSSNLPHASAHAPVHTAPVRSLPKSTHIEHNDPHIMHTAAPLVSSHGAPAVVPVYIEPVAEVHNQDPMQHTAHDPHAAAGKVALGEHHRRSMDIRGITDDEQNYLADEIKSPNTISAAKTKSGVLSILKHNAPVSVLPPTDMVTLSGAPVHAQHTSAPVVSPAPVQHSYYAAAPLVAAVAAVPIVGAIHHAEKHENRALPVPPVYHSEKSIEHKAPAPAPAARIPIAKPPVEMVAPVSIKKTAATTNVPVAAPQIPIAYTHAPSAPILQAPAPAHSHHAAHIAAPLMGAAAAGVKSDEVIVMESAMPKYKEAPHRDTHQIPISAVAPVIPIKGSTHVQAPALAPVVAMKTTTPTTTPNVAPLAAPLAKGKAVAPDVSHKLSHAAAPAAATVAAAAAAAAAAYNEHNKNDAPLQTTHAVKPELKLGEKDVIKPSPLSAAHPMIPVSTEIKNYSSAADKVVNAPRPIIPEEVKAIKTTTISDNDHPTSKPEANKEKDVPILETKKTVAPIAAAVAAPLAVKAIKPTTMTTTYDDPVKPVDVKVAKPVVETAEPVVAAQAVKHEVPVMSTSTTTPDPISVPINKQAPVVAKTSVTSGTTKPAPVPAVRPVVAAAVAAPVVAAAAATPMTTPTVSSAQQYQQQYQQSQQTPASSTSNTSHTNVPAQPSSSTQHSSSYPNTNVVQPPPGYSGAIPAVNEGETVIWVKKVSTTQDFYDSDEDEIDELGYRKDHDMSRYMLHPDMQAHKPQMQSSTTHDLPQIQTDTTHVLPKIQTNTTQFPQVQGDAQFHQIQRRQGPLSPDETSSAQFQQHMQANNSEIQAQTQTPLTNAQIQTRAQNDQFQQQMQAANSAARLHPPQMDTDIARRPSHPQVHPNNPQTRRQSQATFQQHLKEYRRRSSGGVNNQSAGINSNQPHHAAAQ